MSLKIDVILTVNESRQEQLLGRTVIVIDVLRMSSTIVAAFLNGSTEIYPVETSGQAYSMKDERTLLVGERFCKKIQGFDLSNSPTEIIKSKLDGKKIVISTTNGTNAILKATKGDEVLIGSFLNGNAVAQKAVQNKKDITLLCAGTRNMFALEDALCAGFIISSLLKHCHIDCSDLAKMVYASYVHFKDDLLNILPKTVTGTRLQQFGLHQDVQYCAQRDICTIVPYLKNERIFVHPNS